MHLFTTLLGAGLASSALAAYSIQDDYSGNNFFSMFTFDTEDDPTHGYVNYVDQGTAQANNLVSVDNGVVTIRSDSTNVASGRGRNSVRITSTKQYTHGLVVLDLQHMPGSACGIWPAFWMTGPNWPSSGEIDILEGVNLQSQNAITMHTSPGCTMINKDCQGNTGCSTQIGGSSSYGDGFNAGNGGIYAMQWTSDAINVWFFPRNGIPSDATSPTPNPSAWGNPTASFQGGQGCTIDDHFMNNNIVFDTTFCGDWAGAVWGQDGTCSTKAASCQDFVHNHPEAFTEAYWTINSLRVYGDEGGNTQVNVAVAGSNATASAAGEEAVPTTTISPAEASQPPTTAPAVEVNPSTSTSTSPPHPTRHTHHHHHPSPSPVPAPAKRDIDIDNGVLSPFPSVAEQPVVLPQKMEGKVGRHLRRHVLGKGGKIGG